ncbi:MAG TPA: T9SS type A sorting domain-containing protein [Flavobacterium sp.]|jgi:hypothetical protein
MKLILFSLLCLSTRIAAQCDEPVVHMSGTQLINNVSVTVTSFGDVDELADFCLQGPYWINSNFPGEDGGYTFTFLPPIQSVSLGFTAIDNKPSLPAVEEVEIYINGNHYFIPSPGLAPQECSAMAIITPSGNIGGDPSVNIDCGWSNLNITSDISTLTILGNKISGMPAGSIFSLKICTDLAVDDNPGVAKNITIFPNPIVDKVNFSGYQFSDASVSIFNAWGQLCKKTTGINGNRFSIDFDQFSNGLYIVQITELGNIIYTDKIIK